MLIMKMRVMKTQKVQLCRLCCRPVDSWEDEILQSRWWNYFYCCKRTRLSILLIAQNLPSVEYTLHTAASVSCQLLFLRKWVFRYIWHKRTNHEVSPSVTWLGMYVNLVFPKLHKSCQCWQHFCNSVSVLFRCTYIDISFILIHYN